MRQRLRIADCGLVLGITWLLTGAQNVLAQPGIPAADEIPPLAPPLPEIAPTAWEQFSWLLWILVPLLLIIAGAIVWLVLRPGKPPVLVASAAQARTALRALQPQPETGAVLSQISQVTRHYLINAYWLSPLEMTTSDFCAVIRENKQIGPELANALTEYLRALDQRKFAPTTGQPPMGAAGRALELIEMAEARQMALRQPAPANPKT